ILRAQGQIEFAVALLYVVFLSVIGGLMGAESLQALRRRRAAAAPNAPPPPLQKRRRRWIHKLPLKTRFKKSSLYISVIPPIAIGFFVGVLGAVMGVGGGFIMLPAMIYLLSVPTSVVVGTSLFQIMVVMAFTTLLHAVQNKTVDAVLALILLLGGVIGAQLGAELGARLRGEQLRMGLAAMVLAVALKLAYDLVATPDELYSISEGAA
ncbi:MAG: sulfite exporter TauE/SafE family protein, partial [Pseudomonadota bacterium]